MTVAPATTHLDESGEPVEDAPCAHRHFFTSIDESGRGYPTYQTCEDCGATTP